MTPSFRLNERQQNILRATIQHYIATAEPVGSQTLAQEYQFPVSSATIRNALGQLEKAGLLYQPHISAGRIPSDWGYRIYVDNLLTWSDRQTRHAKKRLTSQLQGETWQFDALLRRMGQILASLSGYIALITYPQTETVHLRHLKFIPLSDRQILLILVTNAGHTHSFSLPWPEDNRPNAAADLDRELEIFSNFLNSHLQNKSLSELSQLNWQELDQKFNDYADLLQLLQQRLKPLFQQRSSAPFVVHGVSAIVRQPEFSQLEQVQMLLYALEQEQEALAALIFDSDPPPTPDLATPQPTLNLGTGPESRPIVTLRIGSENPLESMHPCTLISAFYRQNDMPVGSVSVLGPTRMLYQQVIPLVEQAAEYLSEALSCN